MRHAEINIICYGDDAILVAEIKDEQRVIRRQWKLIQNII